MAATVMITQPQLFKVAQQNLQQNPETAGEYQRHNEILFSLVADHKLR